MFVVCFYDVLSATAEKSRKDFTWIATLCLKRTFVMLREKQKVQEIVRDDRLNIFYFRELSTGNATSTTVPDDEPTASGTTLISGNDIQIWLIFVSYTQ